jgi:hypothetical protein
MKTTGSRFYYFHISGVALISTQTIENQREKSLKSRAGGLTIGVATGTKIEGRFKHFPSRKVKKNEI